YGYVSRGLGCRAAAEENFFCRSFEEVVFDQVGPILVISHTSTNRVGVRTRTGDRGAVKVGEGRLDDGYVVCAGERDSGSSLILWSSVHPTPIEHDVIGGSFMFCGYQGRCSRGPGWPCYLQSKKPVVIRCGL